jgi:hypothetical protein
MAPDRLRPAIRIAWPLDAAYIARHLWSIRMLDIILIAVGCGCFAVGIAYAYACDRL